MIRVELSEGQGFVFPLKTRRSQGTTGIDRLIFPKTQLTNIVRIVVVSIDGVFMAGFSEVQLIGCNDTKGPYIKVSKTFTAREHI